MGEVDPVDIGTGIHNGLDRRTVRSSRTHSRYLLGKGSEGSFRYLYRCKRHVRHGVQHVRKEIDCILLSGGSVDFIDVPADVALLVRSVFRGIPALRLAVRTLEESQTTAELLEEGVRTSITTSQGQHRPEGKRHLAKRSNE
ncbi:hypothetical protein BaOVIS_024760 [Babesia ovis]|uniref:Uncharacterized protein n=1 Tax=Babesia ovis TaxID=5869 RepID=A0A9W5TBH5_BABOV|nr:hypothetical protein BaOVIS_024760 [Babesia ovis]